MEQQELKRLLQAVAQGSTSPEDAENKLRLAGLTNSGFTDLGFAKVDNQRGIRQGVAEIVYGEGKTAGQIIRIVQSMREAGQERVLITRLSKKTAKTIKKKIPLSYHKVAGVGIVGDMPEPVGHGTIVVAAAGTSDLSVAEEAALTAEYLGSEVIRLFDVGVAGIHRLFAHAEEIVSAQVIVAVAGMEGALPSVIAGMTSCPVIAVPTSVGYGASLGGMAALLAMLNSCASGVSVVNIDNGFGAGYQAAMINRVMNPVENEKGTSSLSALGELRLDLSQNATRQFLLTNLLSRLDQSAQNSVKALLDEAHIPDKHHHDLKEITQTIDALEVSDRVKCDMRAIYEIVATAEAQVHGCSVEETHFHEVGNAEAIGNVAAICLAIEALDPQLIISTPVQTGEGQVQCAHGLLDIPAPATAAILDRGIPTNKTKLPGELCTPTSAAVILHFVDEFRDE